ncbi:MAG: 6-phosphogluconolactonase [Algibacter sp.]
MKDKDQNVINTNLQEFNTFSANFIKDKLEGMVNKKVLNIALSGGSTPLPILNMLKRFNLNWSMFNFYLVDERVVNLNSSESNYKNINDIFYQYISSKSYSILQEDSTLDEMVSLYKKKIEKNLSFIKQNQPKFDMIILGMGDDGHTASLFPNTEALNEKQEFLVKNYIPQLDCYRVTLTFSALLACEEIIVLIKGKEKIKVFDEVINGEGKKFPISKLLSSKLNWIVGK